VALLRKMTCNLRHPMSLRLPILSHLFHCRRRWWNLGGSRFREMCDLTCGFVWHDSLICRIWLIHIYDMTHNSCIWLTTVVIWLMWTWSHLRVDGYIQPLIYLATSEWIWLTTGFKSCLNTYAPIFPLRMGKSAQLYQVTPLWIWRHCRVDGYT